MASIIVELKGHTNYANQEVASQLAASRKEISRTSTEQLELKRAKEARQVMLDNINDFGARVYCRWNLHKTLHTKYQSGLPIMKIRSPNCEIVGHAQIKAKKSLLLTMTKVTWRAST